MRAVLETKFLLQRMENAKTQIQILLKSTITRIIAFIINIASLNLSVFNFICSV